MSNDVVSRWADPPPLGTEARRRVSVAGVSGGVGTTTLASAIDGIDRGVFVGRPVDVLVCRGTAESLQRAGQAAQLQAESGGRRPVLAVTTTEPGGLSRAVTARLRLTSAYVERVVTVPRVREWRDSTTYLRDARSVLVTSRSELPRALRGYARAALEVRQHSGTTVPAATTYRRAPARTAERTR